ncbi:MAG: ATP-binding cassette domain-containing protein, partial [Oscillospiraceae bacterium]
EIINHFGISSLLFKHPYDLSGGEQQKAALAKILLNKPKILLMDEPTKGFDAYAKKVLGEILIKLKENGTAIIIVTHDIEFAAENADRCALFFDGQIISCDTPNKFFNDNNFYTTAANRISRHLYKNAITCEQVVYMCNKNGEKNE